MMGGRRGQLMSMSLRRYLLFEVANGVLVGVGEEIQDVVFDVVLLQVVHQVGTVALMSKGRERKQSVAEHVPLLIFHRQAG